MTNLTYSKPEQIGLDSDRLQVAYDLLRGWTTGRDAPIPGGAIVVGRHGKIVEPQFFGKQGPEPEAEAIRRDGLFLLASITKPIMYLGAMRLVERGLLNLSDPVTRYIPDFAANHKEDTLVMNLFTHTSGMPDMLPNNVELRRQHATLKKFISGAIEAAPLFAAGTDHSYQSMGTLIVAEIIQRISSLSIRDYLKREVFDPLKLTSIGLGSRGFERKRLVRVETPAFQAGSDFGWNSRYWQELGVPWGGMFASPEDLAVICQLMLANGEIGGVRLLSPGTIHAMRTNRLNDQPALAEAVRRTKPWGLGWRLNHRGTKSSWGDVLGANVFGHTGATGTMCWMDPDRNGFCILLTTAIRSKAPWRLVSLSNAVAAAFV